MKLRYAHIPWTKEVFRHFWLLMESAGYPIGGGSVSGAEETLFATQPPCCAYTTGRDIRDWDSYLDTAWPIRSEVDSRHLAAARRTLRQMFRRLPAGVKSLEVAAEHQVLLEKYGHVAGKRVSV